MLTTKEISDQARISQRHASDIVSGKQRPSAALAIELERITGVPRLSWLYPDEYKNPYVEARKES